MRVPAGPYRGGAPVVGVLLAAGAGRRLGRGPKALLCVDGTPQVVRMARALLRGGCDAVVVVLGASDEEVRTVLDGALTGTPEGQRVRTVVNADWESGMGSSFRLGIEAADRLLASSGPSCGLIAVALVDQPDVGEAVVRRLLAAATASTTARDLGPRVTAAGYSDAQGRLVRSHPLVFPRHWAREAAALAAGDAAGRVWLRGHPEVVDVVDVGQLATGRDVDIPQDLDGLSRGMEADVRA
ncbi:NTP transferase domain-containing protein [Citricoccus sp. K5]|uniref:nucleotidyltransferase family protein n=1 Tax=Citricoccus sp. K5 TaxID=2653135 RepID=UPI0012F1CB81|nr:NTP transferase domain-containing protein [Citricoccus sp. K5]VXB12391.1 Nicotine blue oxidoreductase [Citricoccus sp. K5]